MPISLWGRLLEVADRDRPAIRAGRNTLTRGDLIRLVEQTARQLLASGLEPGDRVMLVLPNGAAHVVAVLAVDAAGGVAVPLAPQAGRQRLAHAVRATAPRLCLSDGEAPALEGTATIRLCVDMAAGRCELSAVGESAAPRGAAPAAEGSAQIRFTSGSSGEPKGVVLEHEPLLWIAQTLAQVFGLDAEHRELVVAPMAHSGGWQRVAATLLGGGCLVIPEGPLSLTGLFEDLESQGVTGFFTPPPLARMMLAASPERARAALSTCRSIEIGSAALGPDELARLIELAPEARTFVHYGLTECSRAVILEASAQPDRLGTVGRPAPGIELEIRDDAGRNLGPGCSGEIFLRGPQRAAGYWQQPELTAERFAGGWLATGDHGQLDDAGFLRFRGRRDDRINCGGYSFFPAEVEAELGAVGGVAQYLVAGVPDPRGVLGEVPWAFAVPSEPEGWTPKQFLAAAREQLPPHMVPRRVLAVAELPLTASGKPDRRRALERYAPGHEG